MLLLSFCSFPWWLAWLLPFLLGLLAGWALWSKYKSMISDYEAKIRGYEKKIASLEADLDACRKKSKDVDVSVYTSKISDLEGRIRSLESDLSACRKGRADLEGQLSIANTKLDANVESAKLTADVDTSGLDLRISELEKALHDERADKLSIRNDWTTEKTRAGRLQVDVGELESEISLLKHKLSTLQGDLDDCRSSKGASLGLGAVSGLASVGSALTPRQKAYAGISNDNLQVIEGIGPKMEQILKDNSINTHGELAATSASKIREILDSFGGKYRIIDPTTWPDQAKLAHEGKWDELITLQKQLDTGREDAANETDAKVEKLLIKLGLLKAFKQDDLKAIEGVGPAIEKLLHEGGIKTWRGLAETSVDRIKSILAAGGSRFQLADPTTWPKQAELAADGKFDELQEYQDFLDGGRA